MKVFHFKTSIRCGGCLKKVTPFLDNLQEVDSWNVDLQTIDKVLTVKTTGLPEDVVHAVHQAGFSATLIKTD